MITEGLFGITPCALDAFPLFTVPVQAWDRMALNSMHAFGHTFDLVNERAGALIQTDVWINGKHIPQNMSEPGNEITLQLP